MAFNVEGSQYGWTTTDRRSAAGLTLIAELQAFPNCQESHVECIVNPLSRSLGARLQGG